MEVTSNKKEMIFRSEKDGKVFYSIGLSKKKQDGSYENGYMSVHFKKDIDLADKTRISIKQAWIDFYKKDKITMPYIFINEFEKEETEPVKEEPKVEEPKPNSNWDSAKDIEIEPDDLPFY